MMNRRKQRVGSHVETAVRKLKMRLTEALLQPLNFESVAANELHPMEGRDSRASIGWIPRA